MQDRPGTIGPRTNPAKVYRIAMVVLVVIFATKTALVLRSVRKGKDRDYIRWYAAAVRVLEGEALAEAPGYVIGSAGAEGLRFYKLPPAFAVCIAPLGLLPYQVYVVVWCAGSVAAAAVALLLTMRLLYGRSLPEDPALLLVPLIGVFAFVMDDLHNGTNNLHLLALLAGGYYLAGRGWPSGGGLSVGLAISWKAFPAAALVAMLLTRRWKLLAWSLVGTFVWTLAAPGAVRGYRRQWNETSAWYGRIVSPYLVGGEQRQWAHQGLGKKNQSIRGLAHRMLRKVDIHTGYTEDFPPDAAFVNVASLPPSAPNAIFAGLVALAAAAIGFVCLRQRAPPTPRAWATDLAIASCFILVASPIAWTYFFSLLLAPLAVGAYVVLGPGKLPSMKRPCAIALIATMPLILGGLNTYTRSFGALTAAAVLWFVVSLMVRRKLLRSTK